MIITTIKSINADLRLLNNTLMSYSNYQSGDWLPRCMLKPSNQNQPLKQCAKSDDSKKTVLSYVSLKIVIPVRLTALIDSVSQKQILN